MVASRCCLAALAAIVRRSCRFCIRVAGRTSVRRMASDHGAPVPAGSSARSMAARRWRVRNDAPSSSPFSRSTSGFSGGFEFRDRSVEDCDGHGSRGTGLKFIDHLGQGSALVTIPSRGERSCRKLLLSQSAPSRGGAERRDAERKSHQWPWPGTGRGQIPLGMPHPGGSSRRHVPDVRSVVRPFVP